MKTTITFKEKWNTCKTMGDASEVITELSTEELCRLNDLLNEFEDKVADLTMRDKFLSNALHSEIRRRAVNEIIYLEPVKDGA